MKIEITKIKEVKEIIEVDFPYYFKHDLMSEYGKTIIYGKILPKYAISIKEDESYNGKKSYEIEKDLRGDCYFADKYRSTVDEFEQAKARLLEFLNKY